MARKKEPVVAAENANIPADEIGHPIDEINILEPEILEKLDETAGQPVVTENQKEDARIEKLMSIKMGKKPERRGLLTNPRSKKFNAKVAKRRAKEKARRKAARKNRK